MKIQQDKKETLMQFFQEKKEKKMVKFGFMLVDEDELKQWQKYLKELRSEEK